MNFYSLVLALLGVAFVTLKLVGVIGWSWWWVTAPFWGVAAAFLALAAGIFLWAGFYMAFARR